MFEATMCGAMLMESENPETRKWFVPMVEYVPFDNERDLVDKARYYLSHPTERLAIATKGYLKSSQQYTGEAFWRRILSEVELRTKGEALRVRTQQTTSRAASGRIYCAFPWYTIQLYPDGGYGPCCHIKLPGQEVPSSLDELMHRWNSPSMQALRNSLATGSVSGTPCEQCSDRLFSTDHDIFGMVPELPRYSTHERGFQHHYERANHAYQQGLQQLQTPPLELYVYTSQTCNLRCIMCGQDKGPSQQFPVERIESIVRELGWNRIDRFGYIGGEPFAAMDALRLLDFIEREETEGACIYITTNGTLLDRHIGRLTGIDNLFMTISIDGFGQTYEHIRVGSSWNRLVSNLLMLKEERKRHPYWRLNINSLVMKSTVGNLLDVLKLSQLLDATVFFSMISGGHPREDFFAHPGLLAEVPTFERDMNTTIEYARAVYAFKAQDSLEKLYLQMDRAGLFRQAAPRDSQPPAPSHLSMEELLATANEAIGKQDWPTAEVRLREMIALDPRDVGPFLVLSDILTLQQKTEETSAVLQEAGRAGHHGPDLLKRIAANRYRRGDRVGSERAFREALVRSPQDPDVLVGLARLCVDSKRHAEARECLRTVLQTTPDNAEAWVGMGVLASLTGDQSTLRIAVEKVQRRDPAHPRLPDLVAALA
ncbi:MAG: radical SAM protein [Chloroflexota bacterium]